MNTDSILADLKAEISKLQSVVDVLEGTSKRRKGKRKVSAASREAISKKLKAAWAKKRKAASKTEAKPAQ